MLVPRARGSISSHRDSTSARRKTIEQVDSKTLAMRRNCAIRAARLAKFQKEDSKNYNQIMQIFNLVDADGGGSISEEELEDLFRYMSIDISQEELRDFIQELDADNSGVIEKDEFIQLTRRCPKPKHTRAEVNAAFQLIAGHDASNGTIDDATLLHSMTHCGRNPKSTQDAIKQIKQIGVGRDGQINYKRYIDAVYAHVECGHLYDAHTNCTCCNQKDCVDGQVCLFKSKQRTRRSTRATRRRFQLQSNFS